MRRVVSAWALLGLLVPLITWANPGELLRSPLLHVVDDHVRGLILASPEWGAIEARRAQLRASSPGMVVELFDQEVLTRLREIQRSVQTRRRMAQASGTEFSEQLIAESRWVEALTASRLRMVDELADLNRDIQEFVSGERFDFVGLGRASVRVRPPTDLRFLRDADPWLEGLWQELRTSRSLSETDRVALESAASQAARRDFAAGSRQLRSLFHRMEDCIRRSSREERNERQNFFFRTDMGIALGITALGFITGAGEREVDWATLPIDLALTVADKFVSSRIAYGRERFRVRWVSGVLLGQGRVVTDFAMFSVWPRGLDDHWGSHPERAAELWARAEWGTAWNIGMSLPTITVNTLLGGWECLSPIPRTRALITMARIGNSYGRAFLFYHGRSTFYDQVLTEP